PVVLVARSPRALARRADHPPIAGSPIAYRSTFRATAKMGRRASEATKLPVKSGQRWPVPVTRPVYGLHGTAWRRVRRGLATRRRALGACPETAVHGSGDGAPASPHRRLGSRS